MRVKSMTVPVLCGQFLRGVGVAVFALVRTGVILPDVLAHHAATGRPLPLVGHLLLLYGRCAVVQQYGSLRQIYIAEHVSLHWNLCHTEIIHQRLVHVGKTDNQIMVYATVVCHAWQVNLLSASGKGEAPFLV